ncbi:probable N-acetylglucosaminyl-phosphatidylinositol de-N-acetylase isoform X3 [Musa acuminata AAA Group]|uniref:probable N-acetylglucosaminyl-phosphatidylinositol de-N-acetylase isoform X3 n=1 Tax=Musa acuminata AAA Group TaxID=214697 RepID=UPI0031E17B0E
MAWFLAAIAVSISFWVISLSRILSSSSCVPSNPPFFRTGSGKKRNVLLVIAHPDDESMFFAPTILFLNSEGHNIHILCISTGNAEGVGNNRKVEIYRACAILKIPLQQVKVLDHPCLQDGFENTWDHELLARLIEDEIKVWDIDSLITFDDFGVSGHPNHRDVHHGIRSAEAFFANILALWMCGYRLFHLHIIGRHKSIVYSTIVHPKVILQWLSTKANGFGLGSYLCSSPVTPT